jgi:hypothetical protein
VSGRAVEPSVLSEETPVPKPNCVTTSGGFLCPVHRLWVF